MIRRLAALALLILWPWLALAAAATADPPPALRGTGDLGVVIERAAGRIAIVEHSTNSLLGRVDGLGDLSHASVVFSRDGRHAFVFGRDGGLSQVDLLTRTLVRRVVQSGNAIGGAISADGRRIAVANYSPGGVRFFDAATLAPLAEVPAVVDGQASKVVGLVETGGDGFAFALWEAGEIWTVDAADPRQPRVRRFPGVGRQPYDGVGLDAGRFYLAGLFGEDGLAVVDLWNPDAGVRRVLPGYGRGEEPLPVFKMPHLEGVALAGWLLFLPAVGRHEILVVDARTWQEEARIAVAGQPVFAVARPDGREVWVNFAHPGNGQVQVIDVPTRAVVATFAPGRAVMHLEFTPKGDQVWISCRDDDRVRIFSTASRQPLAEIAVDKPSGIFFASRGARLGW